MIIFLIVSELFEITFNINAGAECTINEKVIQFD